MGLRVAYVVPYLRSPSGWRSLSLGAVTALKRFAQVEPVVVVSRQDAEVARDFLSGCELLVVPGTQRMSLGRITSWPALTATCVLSRVLFDYEVDLVHSLEAYPTGLVGHWLAAKKNVPHVITAAGTYALAWKASPIDRPMYERVLSRASAFCPISTGTSDLVQNEFRDALSETYVRVVLLGNDSWENATREAVVHRTIPHIPTILSVGAIKPRKGYHISIQAFAKVKSALPSARYWIVGGVDQDGYQRDIQQYIARTGLSDVSFLGSLSAEELSSCYRNASVFVLTPQMDGFNFEGFGLVYLEAGAYGLPVVGTRTGGVSDAVKDGETGYLLEPNDVDGIAQAVLRLLRDSSLATRMGQKNRLWAEELTWERYATEQSEVYASVLARSAGSSGDSR